METYDRYKLLRRNGIISFLPTFILSKKNSDFYEVYNETNRLDKISYKYYGNPNYDWLILMANPEYGSMEYNIPLNSEIRIPYPLDTTIREYEQRIKEYFKQ
jgi:hypothetical protein